MKDTACDDLTTPLGKHGFLRLLQGVSMGNIWPQQTSLSPGCEVPNSSVTNGRIMLSRDDRWAAEDVEALHEHKVCWELIGVRCTTATFAFGDKGR